MNAIRGFLGLLAGLVASVCAYAAPDAGLVNQLSGEVTYSSGAASARAQAFMKVREGDRFSVPAGAQVRVVYFQGGRQETFAGPASFSVGATASTVHSGAQPQVSVLPAGVPQKISQTPELIQIARLGRSGGVAVRGVEREQRLTPAQQAEVRQARDTYRTLRAGAAPDDITPELYLYSVLQDHLLYDDMKPVVEEMAKRQPQSADVAELRAYVKLKTESR
jgi:hypothetical protein